jgi:hypothetical protein
MSRQLVDHAGELQPHKQEQHGVQEEGQDLPDRDALEPHDRRGELRRVPAHVEPTVTAAMHAGQPSSSAGR